MYSTLLFWECILRKRCSLYCYLIQAFDKYSRVDDSDGSNTVKKLRRKKRKSLRAHMSQGGEGDSQNTDNKIATIGWLLHINLLFFLCILQIIEQNLKANLQDKFKMSNTDWQMIHFGSI